MAYVCQLGNHQSVHLDNQGTQTVIIMTTQSLGQQQQLSSSFHTGIWTILPQLYQTPNGVILQITSTQGVYYIQIQGSSIGIMSSSPVLSNFNPLPLEQVSHAPSFTMPPMSPMPPMKMGDMQMSMKPMEMRMGNMEMGIDSTTQEKKRFCSQCGAKVELGDRFCSSCGHSLA